MNDLSECRVLIVDDVQANVDALQRLLRGEHRISVALDGESALRCVEETPPDLVLLDIVMPGMDGYEVCRRLRAAPRTRDIPVMFLSGLEEVQSKAMGFEVGGNDYLSKPFEVLEVKARVRSLLKAKAYSDAVKEKLASELRIAREIQLGILPANISGRLRGTGLDVHVIAEPAREVGGDLYEVLRTADDRVVVVVGDVSGKGIPAALFMAVTMTLVRTMASLYETPQEILQRVNDALASQNPRDMFVTLYCAVFDTRNRKLAYASAGHPSPLLLRRGDPPSLPCATPGLMAGIMPGARFHGRTLDLRDGDAFLFYTDGITEAFNNAGEPFGDARLLNYLTTTNGASSAELTTGLLETVRAHAGDHSQSDDITILAVRFRSPGR